MSEEEYEETPTSSPTPCRIRRRDDVWPPKTPSKITEESWKPCRIKMDSIWPPKYTTVRYLPKTGFSPTIVKEAGQGKKFVWPPPKQSFSPHQNDVNHLPHGHVSQAWNPEANALGNRPPPFAPRTAPQRRCTDDVWPPKGSGYQPGRKPSPRPIKSVGRFEDYIKCRTGPNVPPTYRTPPGTQHIEVTHLEGEYIHESKTTTTSNTSAVTRVMTQQQPQQVTRRIVHSEEEEEEEEEEVEEEEVEEEEEEEEEEESEEE